MSQSLESYLGKYGWDFVKKTEKRIITGWQGDNRSYPLTIETSDTWVSFKVKPFLNLNIDWDSWPEIAVQLMEINDSTSMVKLSIDPDGNIVLGLDVFLSDLNYDRFSEALGVVGHYTELLYDEFLTVLDNIGYRYCESLNILA